MAATLGNAALWVMLPFIVMTLTGLWVALTHHAAGPTIVEELTLSPTQITLTREDAKGRQTWEANPHWVRVTLHPTHGPVPNYLTLQGGPREVELGRFLSEAERITLHAELNAALRA